MKKKTALSRKINIMRQGSGMTQTQLSDLLEVSVRTVASWENGERVPRKGVLEQIARVCHQNAPEGANLGDLVQAPHDMGGWSIYEEGQDSEAEIKKPPEKEEKMLEKYIKLLEEKVSMLEKDNVRLSDLVHKKSKAVGD
jgi:transcriptional regulator with XRE-family HTH domain